MHSCTPVGQQQHLFRLCVGRLGYEEGQVKRLAAELVDGLSSMGNLAGAATVAVQYLADVDNGVSLLAQAREWREALRTAYKCADSDVFFDFRCYCMIPCDLCHAGSLCGSAHFIYLAVAMSVNCSHLSTTHICQVLTPLCNLSMLTHM